jgi:hypothetical protein
MEFSIGNTCNLECIMYDGRASSAIRAHREKLPPLVSAVTEFGWTDLKGKSSAERAKALIALAHSEFQDALTRYGSIGQFLLGTRNRRCTCGSNTMISPSRTGPAILPRDVAKRKPFDEDRTP